MHVAGTVSLLVPLAVTIVVCIVARREGTEIPRAAVLRLAIATIVAIGVLYSLFAVAMIFVLTAALFILFAMPVMGTLERSAIAQLKPEPVRSATIVPRRMGTYVPLAARAASIVAGLALLCWVGMRLTSGRPLFMAMSNTFAALTFFGLFEAWMRQEVFEVRAMSEDDRRRRVRAIFAAQVTLALAFLVMAGLSLGPWPGRVPLTVAGALLGVPGCAFALSTGIQKRYLESVATPECPPDSLPR